MLTEKRLSAIVACYRDAGSVMTMYERLTRTFQDVTKNYEIIYVNDASPDNAEEILAELAGRDDRVTVITHTRNFGSQSAFTSGMRQATGEAVVLMDGDLQDPPEVIEAFVKKWLEGYEVVYGVRSRRMGSPIRNLEYKLFYRVFRKLSTVHMPVDAGDFSLMDRKVIEVINRMPERERFLRGLRAWVGFKQTGVEYVREERFSGETTNSFLDNVRWAKRGIFSFSYVPLEWISYLAFLTVCFSLMAILAYVTFYFAYPQAPRGFLTMLVLILFLGGVQLLSLSVIGEYLGKIFEEVKQRPPYVVKNILNDHREKSPSSHLS